MITVRTLKVECKDKEFYSFLNKEQREQNKALNIAIGYIHTNNILKSVDSGAESRINKGIEKLNIKINKLKKDLENEKITEKKKEQILKSIKTNQEIINGEKIILEEGKMFRKGLDKQFTDIYINNNNLYHLLNKQTQVQYMRTLDLVKQKVTLDYSNNFTDIVTGKCSLMNYKTDFPLMIDNRCINLIEENGEYKLCIMLGYELKIVLGRRENENILELKSILNKIIEDSKNPKSERLYNINNFLRVRTQMQERRKKLQRDLTLTNGGKGRLKKTQLLDKLKQNERNFCLTYNHTMSRRVVDFAKKHKCEYINLEKLTKDGFDNTILRNWSYYELQSMIKYKADREGIKVRFINPAYTSQKCSKCGNIDSENRTSQERFKCTKCNFELNADHNASINIANSIEFIK